MKQRIYIASFFTFILMAGFYYSSIATPQLALWSGNPCSACHISNQGGGMRTEFGWKFSKESSTFSILDEPLASVYSIDKEKYSYLDSLFAFGLDFRYQSTRSNKSEDAVRQYYPMQASIYGNTQPIKGFIIEGQYNYGRLVYLGQQEWSASAIIKPDKSLPYFRIGKFEPAMGLYDCDMTNMDRRLAVPDGSEQFIPPDYSELGAEIIYESLDWLSVNAGIFDSWNLGKMKVWGNDLKYVSVEHNPSFAVKATIYPEWYFEDFSSSFLGASILVNGGFAYYNAFAGYNITDNISIEARYSGSYLNGYVDTVENKRISGNIIGQINYMPFRGIFINFRAETGNANLNGDGETVYDFNANQYIVSGKFLLIPYLELIADYRIVSCEYYTSGRWLFQVHLYY